MKIEGNQQSRMPMKPVHLERVIEAGIKSSCASARGKVLKEITFERVDPGLPLKSIFLIRC